MRYRASGGDSMPLPSVNDEPDRGDDGGRAREPGQLPQAEHRFDAGAMRAEQVTHTERRSRSPVHSSTASVAAKR